MQCKIMQYTNALYQGDPTKDISYEQKVTTVSPNVGAGSLFRLYKI